MGLNINVVKLSYKSIPRGEWDSVRYDRDADFVSADFKDVALEREFIKFGPEDLLWRPKEISHWESWVVSNIEKASQKRYLNILNKMRSDETLYFSESW